MRTDRIKSTALRQGVSMVEAMVVVLLVSATASTALAPGHAAPALMDVYGKNGGSESPRFFRNPPPAKPFLATEAPHTWQVAEMFKIEKGLISKIDALLERSPYGMNSGWSTWEDEYAAGAPFAKWYFPGNQVQEHQWELTDLAIDLVEQRIRIREGPGAITARYYDPPTSGPVRKRQANA